ncbi:hypothetical protein C8R47DRAFT_131657 [Mycena vitilis]|nr:hypothetical protein C8R47DRAFT_131657 [Mycena vitilis]
MPPGQVSRGQGAGTGLRFLTRFLSLWRRDNDHGSSSSKDNSDSSDGNGSNSSGNNKSSNNNSTSDSDGHSSSSATPPTPPCFLPCVPDNDPAVSYSTSWSLNPHGFFQTSHETDVVGSSLSFSFNGTGITVFGSVPPSNATNAPPTAAYSIDGGTPVITAQPLASTTIPNQPLFFASGLPLGTHSLFVNVTDVQSASPFSVDYFILNLKPTAVPSPSAAASPSPSASAISPQKAIASSESKSAAGGTALRVVAGVLGSVIFILLCILAFFIVILRRRRRRQLRSKSMQSSLFTTSESMLSSSYYPGSKVVDPCWNKSISISEEKSRSTVTSYGYGPQSTVATQGHSTTQ